MIKALAKDLPRFPGPANHARCLAHIVNLVARAILRQFDVSKGDDGEDSEDESGAED
jgi:cobalamin biosynthesis protein CobT